jgi:hypothetical protein
LVDHIVSGGCGTRSGKLRTPEDDQIVGRQEVFGEALFRRWRIIPITDTSGNTRTYSGDPKADLMLLGIAPKDFV